MSFTSIFGGTSISPAQPQYELITLTKNIALVWPLETAGGVPYVAAQTDVSPTAGGHTIAMPDATEGSTGIAMVLTNIGASSFSLTDNGGNLIQIVAPSVSYIITLTDNTTSNGAWRSYQLAATTSSANAAALAGLGLQANGSQLQTAIFIQTLHVNTNLTAPYRAIGIRWTGAVGTLQLDDAATLGDGWWCLVTNEGTDTVTITTSGTDTINGLAGYTIPAGPGGGQYYSAMIVCGGQAFHAFSVPTVTPVYGGGTGATNGLDALSNLGGSAIGISIFTAPNAAAILAILGIKAAAITESTINSNTAVDSGSNGIAYVCTAGLALTLAATSTLTTSFFFLVDAQNGAVTFTPDAADQIANQAAGVSYVIPKGSSLLMVTDANGKWWPFFLSGGTAIPWAVGTGSGNAVAAAYTPTISAVSDGLLLAFRSPGPNTVANPTFQADATTARTITKFGGAPLAPGDLANALAEYIVRYNAAHTRYELLNPSTTEAPWAIAGGAADVITATYNPPNSILYDGLLLGFRASAPNATTTPTLAPDGLPAHPITKFGGSPLAIGDIGAAATECLVRYHLAGPNWELLNPATSGTGLGYNSQLFIANGTFTIPANATINTTFKFTVVGGGAGSGGVSTANGVSSGGAGAAGGVIAVFKGFTPSATIAVVVGTNGTGGAAGADGTDGADSTLTYSASTLASGGKGLHSTGQTVNTPSSVPGGNGGSGNATAVGGTTLVSGIIINGQRGAPGLSHTTTAMAFSGQGGNSLFGVGGGGIAGGATGGTGQSGQGPGAGGGGSVRESGADAGGANGAPGVVLVEWWI